jgi:hypothetical protein
MVTIIKKGTSREKIKSLMKLRSKRKPTRRKIDLHKYCGVIKLKEDPLELQKKWRDELE